VDLSRTFPRCLKVPRAFLSEGVTEGFYGGIQSDPGGLEWESFSGGWYEEPVGLGKNFLPSVSGGKSRGKVWRTLLMGRMGIIIQLSRGGWGFHPKVGQMKKREVLPKGGAQNSEIKIYFEKGRIWGKGNQ